MSVEPASYQHAALIKQQANRLGFDLVGITSAQPSQRADYFRQWLDENQAGTMAWMHGRFDERVDVSQYLPGCQSVVCVAISYYPAADRADERSNPTLVHPLPVPRGRAGVREAADAEGPHRNPPPAYRERGPETHPPAYRERGAETPDGGMHLAGGDTRPLGKIARYARGEDYHVLIADKLNALADFIRKLAPDVQTRRAVDTAPVMEKELAARAGIGWMGKNTLVIHPTVGSYFFLGEVLTTLPLPIDQPMTDRCGTCRRCIDACPTGAITGPYQLDARRCISYLTIEHREPIADEFHEAIGDWLFGCDICQEVCPYNRDPLATTEPAFASRFAAGTLDASAVIGWSAAAYQQTLKRSAMKRVKLPVLQRNAAIVLKNAGRQS